MHDGDKQFNHLAESLGKNLNERLIVKWPIASLKGIN